MKFRTPFASAAALGLLSMAAAASAAVTVSLPNELNALTYATGQSILWNFDLGATNISNPNTKYTGTLRSTPVGNVSDSAPPPWDDPNAVNVCCDSSNHAYKADPTRYGSVQNEDGDPGAVFETLNGFYLTSFSFYMGSPDSYNKVKFHFVGGGAPQPLTGDNIWGGVDSLQPGNGDRTKGFRVYYNFNGAKVNKIEFTSTTDAFEYDGVAGTLAVPEPATWALMIGGFGMAGAMLRRRRTAIA